MMPRKPKKSDKIDKDSPKDPTIDPQLQQQIDRLVSASLKRTNEINATKHASTAEELEALAITISEFLDCYILIGYNTEGNAVRIGFAHNQKEADSLSTLMTNLIDENS